MAEPATKLATVDCDVAIVGSGMVGMAVALGLADQGYQVIILESQDLMAAIDGSDADERTLVCNPAAQEFWQELNFWQHLDSLLTPIQQVHVSAKGHFGTVLFDAEDFSVEALGYVVPAQKMAAQLLKQTQAHSNIRYLQPVLYQSHQASSESVVIDYTKNGQLHQLSARLMIAADGARSPIRQSLGLKTQIKSYQKKAIVCQLSTEKPHQNCAYERLTSHGPMAILPTANNRCGFVWSVAEAEAEAILAFSDVEFIEQAQQHFGYRLGQFSRPGQRSAYPLYQIAVTKQYAERVLLMGNAAHTMSPVSAQGLNLAVRGVRRLLKVLNQIPEGSDPGDANVLKAYQASSAHDQQQTLQYTDDLMRWFQNDGGLFSSVRSLGLLAIDNNTHLKKSLFLGAGGFR